jgi:hypothetical protein
MNSTRMTLRRVDPVSAARLVAVLYALLGLIIGAFASLAFMLGGIAGASAGRFPGSPVFGLLFGAGSIILFPILYGVMGFLMTLIGAMAYNGLAGWLGGIQWDVQIAGSYAGVTAPPAGAPPPLA